MSFKPEGSAPFDMRGGTSLEKINSLLSRIDPLMKSFPRVHNDSVISLIQDLMNEAFEKASSAGSADVREGQILTFLALMSLCDAFQSKAAAAKLGSDLQAKLLKDLSFQDPATQSLAKIVMASWPDFAFVCADKVRSAAHGRLSEKDLPPGFKF